MFPISILEKGKKLESLPPGNRYVVARGGVYFYQRQGLIGSLTKIDDIPSLETVQTYATLWIPPLPIEVVSLALAFFRRVFKKLRSECELQLYVSNEQERFLLICPEQQVSHSRVRYTRQPTNTVPPTFLRVGTIHSHCDFGAFHSGTDTQDEDTEDGLHITFGNVDDQAISIAASIAVRKERFKQDPLHVIAGLEKFHTRYKGFIEGDFGAQIDEWMCLVN